MFLKVQQRLLSVQHKLLQMRKITEYFSLDLILQMQAQPLSVFVDNMEVLL